MGLSPFRGFRDMQLEMNGCSMRCWVLQRPALEQLLALIVASQLPRITGELPRPLAISSSSLPA